MPEYNPGGRAIGFTASLDIRLKRGDWITVGTGQNKAIIGQQVKYKIHKSKVSVPQKNGNWDFYSDEGGPVPEGYIDNFKEVVLASVAYGVVNKAGAWMSYKDIKVQGADALVDELRNRPDLYEEIREETIKVALSTHAEEMESLTPEQKENIEKYGTLEVPEDVVEDVFEEDVVKPKKKTSKKKARVENSKKKVKK